MDEPAAPVTGVVGAEENAADGGVSVDGSVELDDPASHPITAAALQHWVTLMANALRHEGVRGPAEASLRFVAVDAMTELNAAHMGGSGPTDVLAFPIDGVGHGSDVDTPTAGGPPVVVGDVVICPDVAARACSPTRTLDDEIALLVVHGTLHLLGHDHAEPDEKAVMQHRERELLTRYVSRSADAGMAAS